MNQAKYVLLSAILLSSTAYASGMKPETSIVIIDESKREGTINVTNTEKTPLLLYTKIENIKEDDEDLVVVTSPYNRVDGGETQTVRFILTNKTPLKVQRLKRVTFEGIPPESGPGKKLDLTIRQNIPLILTPAGLVHKRDPWTLLTWQIKGSELTVINNSPYIVRLSNKIDLLPAATSISLSKTYILPGSTEKINIPHELEKANVEKIRLYPASIYGYKVEHYDSPVTNI